MTGQDFLLNAWRSMCGIPEKEPQTMPSMNVLKETEWSPNFERLMRNRLIMGAFRYGLLRAPNKSKYDRVKSMENRLKTYSETGNLEMLVDIANLALCEFEEGVHPHRHFRSVDDGEHVETPPTTN